MKTESKNIFQKVKMVNNCVAPGCEEGCKKKKEKGGSNTEELGVDDGTVKEKVSLFKFPD